jgi:AcrR family transcriptional regulator
MYSPAPENRTGIRSIARDAVRERISHVALELFDEHGFENVTIEQVASRAGISARSVHRYFPARCYLVIGMLEANGEIVRDVLLTGPAGEPALISLRAAYMDLVRPGADVPRYRSAVRLLSSTPALRARNVEKHLAWAETLTPLVAERIDGADAVVRARVLVDASLAAFTVSMIACADDPAGR